MRVTCRPSARRFCSGARSSSDSPVTHGWSIHMTRILLTQSHTPKGRCYQAASRGVSRHVEYAGAPATSANTANTASNARPMWRPPFVPIRQLRPYNSLRRARSGSVARPTRVRAYPLVGSHLVNPPTRARDVSRAALLLVAVSLALCVGCSPSSPEEREPGSQSTTLPGESGVAAGTRGTGADAGAEGSINGHWTVSYASLPKVGGAASGAEVTREMEERLDGAYDLPTDRGVIQFGAPTWTAAYRPTPEQRARLAELDAALADDSLSPAERHALREKRIALRREAMQPVKSISAAWSVEERIVPGAPAPQNAPRPEPIDMGRAYYLYHPDRIPGPGPGARRPR